MNWLQENLQKWTPFSVVAIIITTACMSILVYDSITGIPIPGFFYVIVSIVLGGTGATTLFSHGVKVANGVAKDTARAVVEQAVSSGVINANQSDQVNSK